jgi:hypothetical protein
VGRGPDAEVNVDYSPLLGFVLPAVRIDPHSHEIDATPQIKLRQIADIIRDRGRTGFTDPTEKIASLLKTLAPDLRVIVPCLAKSNGTMLALVGSNVIVGPCSELGPTALVFKAGGRSP